MTRRHLRAAVLLVGLAVTPSLTATPRQQQEELVVTLQRILNRHLRLDGCTLAPVDSETAFVVQIFCSKTDTPRLLGQSGMFLRSLKILFNDLYLDWQQRQLGSGFTWDKAKKMHLRFIEKE